MTFGQRWEDAVLTLRVYGKIQSVRYSKCMGAMPCISAIFSKKGNFFDFLFAFLSNETFKKGQHLWKEFAPPPPTRGAKIFPLRVEPYWEGGKNENGRLTSHESVNVHLKSNGYTYALYAVSSFYVQEKYFCVSPLFFKLTPSLLT